jgi:hypothetical protein
MEAYVKTISERAKANAIPLEIKKDGLQQRQNGDWVLRFTVQAADMDERLTKAAMGTRFVAALVEIGENEEPVIPKPEKLKRDWHDLNPAAQAGIRCSEPAFLVFLKAQHPDDWAECTDAAECVRLICGVHSRVELGINQKARVIWHSLDSEFQAWRAIGA